jgi:uncharacterized RDD family membrane protein YckC
LVSEPSWKQEVNRRLAAHQSRKGLSVVQEHAEDQDQAGVSDRAAKAAARVAARFSTAPSYADMQASEARAALREAEVATRAALEAQAVAQAALAELQRIADERAEFERAHSEASAPETVFVTAAPDESIEEFYVPEPVAFEESSVTARFEDVPAVDHPVTYAEPYAATPQGRESLTVDAQPIHANLIHFPRELVATRRLRPRLSTACEPSVEEQQGQLSIFEVDPNSIAIGPSATVAEEVAPAPSWSGPEWTNFDLDLEEREKARAFDGEPPSIAARIELAPFELRCMATLVDLALIVGLTCAGVAGIAGHLPHGSATKMVEMAGVGGLFLTGLAYYAFFLLVAMSTPGMMYARIGLCTFDDEHPTRTQLRGRLGACMVSLLPVGLGMAWAIFDEDHLTWHDRISRTYLRRC